MLDELDFIDRFLRPLADHKAAIELRDDGAIIPYNDIEDYIIVQDMIVSGTHFFPNDPAQSTAAKLLRCNLSDLAAMGATPQFYVMSCGFHGLDETWVNAFSAQLKKDIAYYGGHLIGGDTTTASKQASFSLTAIGTVPKNSAVLRSNAKVGDLVFVTGTIGESFVARQMLENNESLPVQNAYHFPNPPVALGQDLVGVASSMIDVSDGLVRDLKQVCEASGVGADVRVADIPMVEFDLSSEMLLTAGDDYQLLFTASVEKKEVIERLGKKHQLVVSAIGEITAGGVNMVEEMGELLDVGRDGYVHG